jgi:hypothetical protein
MNATSCHQCAHASTCRYIEGLRRTALTVAEVAERNFAFPYTIAEHAREVEVLLSGWCRHFMELPRPRV